MSSWFPNIMYPASQVKFLFVPTAVLLVDTCPWDSMGSGLQLVGTTYT